MPKAIAANLFRRCALVGRRVLTALCATVIAAGAAWAAPLLTLSGSCDTFGNSTFSIVNLGSAMTVPNTWELYQNTVFLTSGQITLTAAGTTGDRQTLTINGLYGTLKVDVRDQSNAVVVTSSVVCVQRPLVTINQASTQSDPATTQPIRFTAVFNRPVTGFAGTDVQVTGVSGTPTVSVTDSGDHMTYTVAVSGVADLEVVQVRIPQDAAVDATGLGNLASTSSDNRVTFRAPPNLTLSGSCDLHANSLFTISNLGGAMLVPYSWELYQNTVFLTSGQVTLTAAGTSGANQQLTINGLYGAVMVKVKTDQGVEILSSTANCPVPTVTINQAATQADPVASGPVLFDVLFSVEVTGLTNTDVQVSGMAATPVITVTDSGDHKLYRVSVAGAASGETVRATLPAGAAKDASNNVLVGASTSTDNSVTVDSSRRVVSLVVDPVNGQAVIAALFGGGIWRSSNGGGTWSNPASQPGSTWLTALLIDPSQTGRYYVATLGAGIYRSTNSGTTWSACGSTGLGSQRVRTLAIGATGALLAATEAGVYRSADCSTWTAANQGLPAAAATPVTTLLVDPSTASTHYAGLDGGGVFRSVDSGATWMAAMIQPASNRITALAARPGGGGPLFAASHNGVHVSADGGNTWAACAAQPASTVVLSLALDGAGVIYAGTESALAVSRDGCGSWQAIASGDLTGTGPVATGQGGARFAALAIANDTRRTLYAGNRSGTVQRTDVMPLLLAVSVSGTTRNATTLNLTSSELGKALWIVVPRNSTAPTFAQVRAGAGYSGVSVVAAGSLTIQQNTPSSLAVAGLAPDTDYDLYAAVEDSLRVDGWPPLLVQFKTLPNTYSISVTVAPAVAGSASCTPNPVNEGGSSTCTLQANPVYAAAGWSGDCSGATCVLDNVTGPRSVTAHLVPTLNVDGSDVSSRYQPATDGQVIMRYLQGIRGGALLAGAVVSGASVSDPAVIAAYLDSLGTTLDIDGNGSVDAATDGVLIVRYMLGIRGEALIADALGPGPRSRSQAVEIEQWLAALMP